MTMRDGGHSLKTDRAGQSTTIGIVLILGITLIGTGLVVGYGAQAIDDTERVTTLSKAEHAMTQFDSQAAIVALGESAVQRVSMGSSAGGQFVAEENTGWIKIVHRNATGDGTPPEEIYKAPLGVVRYQNGGTSVAYQGGGVWRRSDNGSTMLSPPEFNYRGATLTLPIIRVTNNDSAAGETTALIKRAADSRRVYPNQSSTYADGRTYSNPITSGSVAVTVKSEFYKGWAEFFRTRTAGNVSVDHANGTSTVELITFDTIGDFSFSDALDADGLSARGQSAGHSLTNFSVTIESDSGNAFNNHYISFYAEEDGHRFEYLVHVPDGVNCNSGVEGETLHVKTFYRNTVTGEQHEWSNTSSPAGSGPIRLECSDGGSTLHISLTSSQPLTYGDTSADGTYYDWSGTPVSDAYFGHTEDGEPTTFEPTNTTTSRNLSRHYVALLGDEFTLNARSGTGGPGQGGGAQIDFSNSGGTIEYDTGGETYITYLHVTENRIEVQLE